MIKAWRIKQIAETINEVTESLKGFYLNSEVKKVLCKIASPLWKMSQLSSW